MCVLCSLSLSLSFALYRRVTYEATPARSVFIKLPEGRGKYKKVAEGGVQGSGIDYQFSGHLITMNVPRERELERERGSYRNPSAN